MRGATARASPPSTFWIISIHAPREGSDGRTTLDEGRDGDISIHAPREGSDQQRRETLIQIPGISIHAPREGSDDMCPEEGAASMEFQSTLPVRGATHIYLFTGIVFCAISIHAPREGSDSLRLQLQPL